MCLRDKIHVILCWTISYCFVDCSVIAAEVKHKRHIRGKVIGINNYIFTSARSSNWLTKNMDVQKVFFSYNTEKQVVAQCRMPETSWLNNHNGEYNIRDMLLSHTHTQDVCYTTALLDQPLEISTASSFCTSNRQRRHRSWIYYKKKKQPSTGRYFTTSRRIIYYVPVSVDVLSAQADCETLVASTSPQLGHQSGSDTFKGWMAFYYA